MKLLSIITISLLSLFFIVSNVYSGMAKVGETAPQFELETLDGNKIKLADYKGKVLVLDFFALWCKPCKEELPLIQKVYQEMKSDSLIDDSLDFEILLFCIDSKSKKDKVKTFLSDLSINITTLIDAGKTYQMDYGLRAMPTLIIIDKNSIVREIIRGENKEIDKLIKEKVTALSK